MYRQLHPFGDPDKYARLAFASFDTDKNGRVTFGEFLIATSFVMSKQHRNDRERVMRLAFDIYDEDASGEISGEEAERVVRAVYELEGVDAEHVSERVEEIFRAHDRDASASLSKSEFLEAFINDPVVAKVFVYC